MHQILRCFLLNHDSFWLGVVCLLSRGIRPRPRSAMPNNFFVVLPGAPAKDKKVPQSAPATFLDVLPHGSENSFFISHFLRSTFLFSLFTFHFPLFTFNFHFSLFTFTFHFSLSNFEMVTYRDGSSSFLPFGARAQNVVFPMVFQGFRLTVRFSKWPSCPP